MAEEVERLPDAACPENNTVAVLTLHPAYLAKSYFPLGLLQSVGLEAIGSRSRQIRPEKGAKPASKGKSLTLEPKSPTPEIFVSASRTIFRRWASSITRWREGEPGHDELIRLEDVRVIPPEERLRPMRTNTDLPLLEVVLRVTDDYILERTPGKDGKVPQHADTDSFFKLKALYNTEEELRRDAHLGDLREAKSKIQAIQPE